MGDRVLFAQVISFPTLSYSHWALLSHLEKERCSAQGTTTCRASEGFYSQWSQLKMDHEKIQKNLTTGECVALGNWSTTVTRGMLGYVWSWHMHLIRMSVKGSQRKKQKSHLELLSVQLYWKYSKDPWYFHDRCRWGHVRQWHFQVVYEPFHPMPRG